MRSTRSIVAVALILSPTMVLAEITGASAQGFGVKHTTELNLPPPAAWAAIVDVAKWWDPEHTYSGDSRNLSLDPTVRGCFCEKLELYAGIEHLRVIYARAPRTLRLAGALGSLQEFGVNGSLTWTIEPNAGGSRVIVTYSVGGFADRPLSEWAPMVDEVLGTQVRRLGRFVNTGSPEERKPVAKP